MFIPSGASADQVFRSRVNKQCCVIGIDCVNGVKE